MTIKYLLKSVIVTDPAYVYLMFLEERWKRTKLTLCSWFILWHLSRSNLLRFKFRTVGLSPTSDWHMISWILDWVWQGILLVIHLYSHLTITMASCCFHFGVGVNGCLDCWTYPENGPDTYFHFLSNSNRGFERVHLFSNTFNEISV